MDYKRWLAAEFNKTTDWVLITGGTSGIGLQYVRLFAQEKCRCLVISNEKERLEQLTVEIKDKFGVTIVGIFCDLSKYDDVVSLEATLAKYCIKVLINNAGFGLKGDFLSLSKDIYRDIVAVNALAPTLIAHMVLPKMREMNCGAVIFVATINVASPIPLNSVYTATKFYTWASALAISQENSGYNIIFQVMLPGTTDTPFHEKQGVRPQAMVMTPDIVAKRSLDHLDSLIYIPNTADRVLFPIVNRLPLKWRMKLATIVLKKRLGVK